jgi:hypothetical protein
MGREVRKVPANWEHPKDSNGKFIPLMDDFHRCEYEWYRGYFYWANGMIWDYGKKTFIPRRETTANETYAEYCGERPKQEDYMPDWPEKERTHYQMYEDCTEGTPISPVMETPEKLAHWLADNNASAFGNMTATYDQWLAMIKAKSAPSMILTNHGDGTATMQSGVEAIQGLRAEA